jgi:hypothetical protein
MSRSGRRPRKALQARAGAGGRHGDDRHAINRPGRDRRQADTGLQVASASAFVSRSR